VVIDITGVAAMDSNVANHLGPDRRGLAPPRRHRHRHGLSPEIAQTLVNIGVDLAKDDDRRDLAGRHRAGERLWATRWRHSPIRDPPRRSDVPAGKESAPTWKFPILKQGPYLIASIQSR
jgi:hypothetical protein